MRALRRLAQTLGLIYEDDGNWRPPGLRVPPALTRKDGLRQVTTNPRPKCVVMTCTRGCISIQMRVIADSSDALRPGCWADQDLVVPAI